MPTIRDWTAATSSGLVTRESAPGRQVPEDAREVHVETDRARLRAVVCNSRGERLRVFTRKSAHFNTDFGQVGATEVPVLELSVAAESKVRLYVRGDEFVLTTEDINGPVASASGGGVTIAGPNGETEPRPPLIVGAIDRVDGSVVLEDSDHAARSPE